MAKIRKREAAARVPTFRATISSKRGVTLLEILVVIVIMATFISFALPRFQSNLELHLKKESRKLAGTIQYLYNQAALKNRTYRIHFDLDNHRYWVEASQDSVYLSSLTPDRSQVREDLKKTDEPKFENDNSLLKKPVELEHRIRFKDIKTEAQELALTSGDAYIHFFPHGYAEEATIRIQSEQEVTYTLKINSLTGRATVYDRDIENP